MSVIIFNESSPQIWYELPIETLIPLLQWRYPCSKGHVTCHKVPSFFTKFNFAITSDFPMNLACKMFQVKVFTVF